MQHWGQEAIFWHVIEYNPLFEKKFFYFYSWASNFGFQFLDFLLLSNNGKKDLEYVQFLNVLMCSLNKPKKHLHKISGSNK